MAPRRFVVGPMAVNCYIVRDPATGKACVIDPGADPDRIRRSLEKDGLKLEFIINTHGHGDHIAANSFFGVPVYIHSLDKDFLTDPKLNLSAHFIFTVRSRPADRLLEDGERIMLGETALEVIHTPGHTPGSISVKCGGSVFTGDTLFQGGVGRTDFDYGDESALYSSIAKKLMALPDETVIYPGHGGQSTIGEERRSNPFIN
jgi:glyoxylase-like metal-dependent hydrolase (beta-lactamase superfamily II)